GARRPPHAGRRSPRNCRRRGRRRHRARERRRADRRVLPPDPETDFRPMKHLSYILLLPALLVGAPADRRADTVVLDAAGVANLRSQTVVTEPGLFEETVFALGRIEVYPGNRAVVSSRVAGRALAVPAKLDHPIEKGDVAVVLESRQIGDPPPR